MPRATGSSATPAPAPTSQPGTGLVRSMPEDIRRELLNAQKGMLGERAKPYNQWSSRGLIPAKLRPGEDPATAKGKAVSNYRILYVMMAGREVPMEMIIPSTSISSYDEYLSSLIQRGIPVQGIVTKFTQQQQSKNGQRFCTALFTMEAELDDQGFANAMAMRTQWRNEIEGRVEELVEATVENAAAPAVQSLEDQAAGAATDDEDIPF
jgi:hypothetical protein